MRLIDFKTLAIDFNNEKQLCIQIKNYFRPVTLIQIENNKIFLVSNNKEIITLGNFLNTTKQLSANTRIYKKQPEVQELFGYRIVDNKLMFM